MLRHIFIFILFFIPLHVIGQLRSYVEEATVKQSGYQSLTLLNTSAVELVGRDIQFLDGWSRPIQHIRRMASPTRKDVVQRIAYDVAGRQRYQYLPYTTNINIGGFKSNVAYDQAYFYISSLNGNVHEVKTEIPYGETRFENSPLQRVLEEGFGERRGINTNNSIRYEYGTNSTSGSDVVKLWIINANGATSTANHPEGALFRTVKKDENWKDGNGKAGVLEEYKDVKGRVLLKRIWETASKSLSTYYLYDDFDRLRYVIPPAVNENGNIPAINQFTETDASCVNFIYAYHYDDLGRIVEKKVPGKGWEFLVYNDKDQLVLSQDAIQKGNNEWLFTKYDVYGRIIIKGIYQSNPQQDRAYFQQLVDGQTSLYEERIATGIGYSSNSFPQNIASYHAINYYDSYDFPDNVFGTTVPTGHVSGIAVKNLLTGSKVAVLGSTNMLLTVSYYDAKGQVLLSKSQNYLGGTDEISSTYSFTGQLLSQVRSHKASPTGVETLIKSNFVYDHDGRLVKELSKINSQPEVTLKENLYNELGQVKTKALHGNVNGGIQQHVVLGSAHSLNDGDEHNVTAEASITLTPGFFVAEGTTFSASISKAAVQRIGYTYDEKGWVTQINNPDIVSDQEVFGMKLNYDKYWDYNPLLHSINGNINSVSWQTKIPAGLGGVQQQQRFDYTYDKLNRLTKAIYLANGANDFYNEELTYDVMGNIQTLKRKKGAAVLYNDFSYSYTEPSTGLVGNQLYAVTDVGTAAMGNTFSYDINGRQISNNSLGISNIQYNYLSLPERFTAGAQVLKYTYDAAGTKLRKKLGSVQTDYVGGIQYQAGHIDFIMTNEGRAFRSGDIYIYEYFLKDHLGNTRAVVDEHGSIKQTQDYYAFGMEIKPSSPANKYLYNGKEKQEELGLDQLDYGARFYDPVIGRWNVIDMLAEFAPDLTPFRYCFNNPVNYTDPFGLWEKTATGYFTDNIEDIERFMIMVDIEKNSLKNKNLSISQMSNFVNGEMKPGGLGMLSDGSKLAKGFTITQKSDFRGSQWIVDKKSYNEFWHSVQGDLTPNALDTRTLHHNILWTTYPGPDNPKKYNGKDDYSYIPANPVELSGIKHDLAYDKLKIKGSGGLFTEKKAIPADWTFVGENLLHSMNPNLDALNRFRAVVVGVGLGAAALPKTIEYYMPVMVSAPKNQ